MDVPLTETMAWAAASWELNLKTEDSLDICDN